MGTVVALHAHPDDECILTGGTLARASAEGHRVVLIVATNGDHGEVPDDLADGETLVDRRRRETLASAEVLGVHRVEFLGYNDSGMTGWDQNSHAHAFVNAPVEDAAQKVADILIEESADVLIAYDWHGGYGHPDHIHVHRVGHHAAQMVPSVRLLEGTMNRDAMRERVTRAKAMGLMDDDFDVDGPADDGNPMGSLEAEIDWVVDVAAYALTKRRAISCHRSQISDSAFFLAMPEEAFVESFGQEYYIEPGRSQPMTPGWIVS